MQRKEGEEGKRQEEVIIYSNFAAASKTHEVIMHVLDRKLPGDADTEDRYYPATAFESTIEKWSGIPVIFSEIGEHPDLDLYDTNPEEALKQAKAWVVGSVTETWIDKHGRSKLMGMINIKDDKVEKLFDEGKLSPSTGFRGTALGNTLTGVTKPGHLLLFEESSASGVLPRDLGSQILNKVRPCQMKNGVRMAEPIAPAAPAETTPAQGIAPGVLDRLKTLFSEALSILEGKTPEPDVTATSTKETPKVTTITSTNSKIEVDNVDEALKSQVETLTKEMAALKEANTKIVQERDSLKTRVDAIDAAAREEKWNNVKQHLEIGLIDTPEKIAAERAKYDSDREGYVLAAFNTKQTNTRKKEGETVSDGELDPVSEKYIAAKNASKSVMRRGRSA